MSTRTTIALTAAALLVASALAGCSGTTPSASKLVTEKHRADVTGFIYFVQQGKQPQPLPGDLSVTSATGTLHVKVRADGMYKLNLPIGNYQFTATSPSFHDGGQQCAAVNIITLHDGENLLANVLCEDPQG